jgi:type I site-specific restriction endonuclease
MASPEELARHNIDALLTLCGWKVQKRSEINLSAGRGIAITEGLLKGGDEADYLLFVDGKAIGTVEAKPEGYTLTGVEEQSGKYGKVCSIFTRSSATRCRSRMKAPGSKRNSPIASIQIRKVAMFSHFIHPRRSSSTWSPSTS